MSRINDKAGKSELKGLALDEWDRRNIESLIRVYDETFPYPHVLSIKFQMDDARRSVKADTRLVTKNNLDLRKAASLPTPLHQQLIKGYPTILSDSKQFKQFLKWFPVFDLSK